MSLAAELNVTGTENERPKSDENRTQKSKQPYWRISKWIRRRYKRKTRFLNFYFILEDRFAEKHRQLLRICTVFATAKPCLFEPSDVGLEVDILIEFP